MASTDRGERPCVPSRTRLQEESIARFHGKLGGLVEVVQVRLRRSRAPQEDAQDWGDDQLSVTKRRGRGGDG